MNLNELIYFLNESLDDGSVVESSPVIALCRNTHASIDSEEAWVEMPIIDVEVEEDEVNLLMTASEEKQGLSVCQLVTTLQDLSSKCGQCRLFVCGDHEPVEGHEDWEYREDLPVITVVRNPELKMVGIMPWYEGCDKELEE